MLVKKISNGKIYSIDANPFMIEQTAENIFLNDFKNINLINVWILDKIWSMNLNLTIDPAFSSFWKPFSQDIIEIKKVDITTIDKLFYTESISKIDFIKIDIEWLELKALQWWEKTLKKFKPTLSLEISSEFWSNLNEIFNFMKKLSYCVFNYQDWYLKKEVIQWYYRYENLIFIHKDKLNEFSFR